MLACSFRVYYFVMLAGSFRVNVMYQAEIQQKSDRHFRSLVTFAYLLIHSYASYVLIVTMYMENNTLFLSHIT